jgi:hypothetical protein
MPTPVFNTIGKHLLMRYPTGNSFTFNNVRTNATDEGILDLANAFSSIQHQEPSGVYSVLTREIIMV